MQWGHLPYIDGEFLEHVVPLPISFKDISYTISAGMWCTAGSSFQIAPKTENTFKLSYETKGWNVANTLYSESSYIAIGAWK